MSIPHLLFIQLGYRKEWKCSELKIAIGSHSMMVESTSCLPQSDLSVCLLNSNGSEPSDYIPLSSTSLDVFMSSVKEKDSQGEPRTRRAT